MKCEPVRRREFITLLGSAAAAWPLAARAQQQAMPVIGILNTDAPVTDTSSMRAFHQGLSQSGFVEGRNVAIEYRWAESQVDRLPALAADLVRRQVTVIVTPGNTAAALAAKAATATIPIVFALGLDPVAAGLVASLNRPGGNVTGVTSLNLELGPKLLEVLHELVPRATIMALLVNPTNQNVESQLSNMQAAARTLGLPPLHVLQASTERDFDRAFAALVQLRAGGLVISSSTLYNARSEQLAALAIRHAVPTISPYREFAAAGGLMSYGGNTLDQQRLAGNYTGRILKGEKPADLPVQQATRVELIINMKTAKALGLTFPLTLLGRADEVIE
jgi:putative ABC transport system substrate-binding protein